MPSSTTPIPPSSSHPTITLTVSVQPPYLSALLSGLKTHEGRLARPRYLALQPDDHIAIIADVPESESGPEPRSETNSDRPPPPQSHSHDPAVANARTGGGECDAANDVNDADEGDATSVSSTSTDPTPGPLPHALFVVKRVTRYDTFLAMLNAHGVEAFLPGFRGSVEAAARLYRSFPGYEEGERRYGAVAVEVEVVWMARDDA